MIITTHAVVAAASAHVISQTPVDAFLLGFISHFILDALPHWDYDLDTVDVGFKLKPVVKDALKVGLDFIAGFLLVFSFFQWQEPFNAILWLAALGGITPDILHNLENFWKAKPIKLFSKFHLWCHCRINLNNVFLGITTQVIIIAAFIYFLA